jgi:arylsulfatase A-like enzyme
LGSSLSDRTPRRVLLVGVGLGLAYGLLEGLAFFALGLVPGVLTWLNGNSAYALWFCPVFYGTVYGALGCLVAIPALGWRRVPWDSGLAFVLGALSVFLALTLPGRVLPDWSAAILAAGISSVWTRRYHGDRERWTARIRRSLPYLALAVLVAIVTTVGLTAVRERAAMARLPDDGPERPNVLLIVLDTVRGDHLSLHGYRRRTTPNLDRLAAESLVFEAAYANSSWTLPTHASLMTGTEFYEHRAGQLRRPYLDGRLTTLAEVLRSSGYATGGFVANTFWCGRPTGLARGFIRYEDFYGNLEDAVARTVLGRRLYWNLLARFHVIDIPGRKRAADVNRALLAWVDDLDGRPFFAFANYFDAHGPFLPPPEFRGRFGGDSIRPYRDSDDIEIGALTGEIELPPLAERLAMIDGYDESLLYLDAQLGRLFDELEARGILDDTLIIVTSDHGENWGEHGFMYHGHSAYYEQIYVPLMVRYPRQLEPGRSNRPVSLVHVPATVLDLLGMPSVLPGESLRQPPTEPVLIEVYRRSLVPASWPTSRGWVKALVTDRWHYIREEAGREELYDIVADPQELHDLAGTEGVRPLLDGFRAELERRALDSGPFHHAESTSSHGRPLHGPHGSFRIGSQQARSDLRAAIPSEDGS